MPRRMLRTYGAVRSLANHENSTGITKLVNSDVK